MLGRNKEGAHVADKRLGNAGQQIDRLTGHGLKIGTTGKKERPQRQGAGGSRAEAVKAFVRLQTDVQFRALPLVPD
jgi:hypothetical protein